MRHSLIPLLVALVTAFSSLQADPVEKEPVRIALKWFYQYQFAGYIMAKEKGFYDELGLDVTLIERDPGKNHIMEVINGNAEYGVADSSILLYRARKHPVKLVSTIFQHNAMVMIAKRESGIISPYEMKGKRISYQEGVDDAIFTTMFEYAGITTNDFTKLPMDFSYEKLIDGEIDVIAAYITDQPYWIRKRGIELNIINPLSYGIDLYGDNLFTTEQEINRHPERVEKIRQATIKGWKYALAHKEETVNVILKKYKPSLDFDQLMYEAQTTERLISPEHVKLGYTSQDRFYIIANVYRNVNIPYKALEKAVNTLIYDPDKDDSNLTLYLYIILIAGLLGLLITSLLYINNRRLQKLVIQRTKELELSQQEALEYANSKAKFLANMSHEIRTPMNAILGFVDQLAKGEEDSNRKKQFKIIKNSGQTLLTIINDILDFSKIESGKLDIDIINVNTENYFHDIAANFKETSQNKHINFEFNVDDDFPQCIVIDPVRLSQIIFNLLSNAMKFTPEFGTVTFNVQYNTQKQALYCSVRDTGIGIAKENIGKVFNAFDQEDSSTTRNFGGTGLGLSISSQLVKMMNGELKLHSVQGEGSHFFFEIPVQTCHSEPQSSSPAETIETEGLTFSGRILVVEDNKTNQMLMGIILDDFGLEYDVAENGVEGFEAIKKRAL